LIRRTEKHVVIVIALIVIALLIGGIGLLLEGLWWMFVIAVAFLIASAVVGLANGRRRA
jgi:hypothetical protein